MYEQKEKNPPQKYIKKTIPDINDARDDHCIVRDLNGMFPEFPKTIMDENVITGKTYLICHEVPTRLNPLVIHLTQNFSN